MDAQLRLYLVRQARSTRRPPARARTLHAEVHQRLLTAGAPAAHTPAPGSAADWLLLHLQSGWTGVTPLAWVPPCSDAASGALLEGRAALVRVLAYLDVLLALPDTNVWYTGNVRMLCCVLQLYQQIFVGPDLFARVVATGGSRALLRALHEVTVGNTLLLLTVRIGGKTVVSSIVSLLVALTVPAVSSTSTGYITSRALTTAQLFLEAVAARYALLARLSDAPAIAVHTHFIMQLKGRAAMEVITPANLRGTHSECSYIMDEVLFTRGLINVAGPLLMHGRTVILGISSPSPPNDPEGQAIAHSLFQCDPHDPTWSNGGHDAHIVRMARMTPVCTRCSSNVEDALRCDHCLEMWPPWLERQKALDHINAAASELERRSNVCEYLGVAIHATAENTLSSDMLQWLRLPPRFKGTMCGPMALVVAMNLCGGLGDCSVGSTVAAGLAILYSTNRSVLVAATRITMHSLATGADFHHVAADFMDVAAAAAAEISRGPFSTIFGLDSEAQSGSAANVIRTVPAIIAASGLWPFLPPLGSSMPNSTYSLPAAFKLQSMGAASTASLIGVSPGDSRLLVSPAPRTTARAELQGAPASGFRLRSTTGAAAEQSIADLLGEVKEYLPRVMFAGPEPGRRLRTEIAKGRECARLLVQIIAAGPAVQQHLANGVPAGQGASAGKPFQTGNSRHLALW